ncbi:B12-binding domain-containing radical SAM protein [Patescibacteria group bacterium]|nr:B12-binding domain-containing radical SAM protein [Patescibacteria group bacterium]
MKTKKKVLLFNSPIIKEKMDRLEMGNTFPRIGISSIAAHLRESGIKIKVFDPIGESSRKITSIVKRFDPDIVGIPAYTSEIYAANETARFIKKINPKIFTIVGGAHPSALPKRTLEEFYFFDAVAFGEGEETALELAQDKPLNRILSLAYKEGDKIKVNKPRPLIKNFDDLPFPAWELFDLDKYRGGSIGTGFKKSGRRLEIPVEGARGCPFNCNFCFRVSGRVIRFKSPEKIIEEIRRAINKFGATDIFFVEGTFAVNRQQAEKLCDLLIETGLNQQITWSTGGRVDVLGERLLKKMKKSGCVFIGYGVESGDQEMLDKMGKQTKLEQIVRSFNDCKKIGIATEANFIIGHPFETEEKVLKTIKFARNLNADHANFAIMVPFPGTEVYEMAKKGIGGLKLLTYDWRVYGKQIGAALESDQLPREKLIKLQNKAYFQFYSTPRRLPLFIKRLTPGRIFSALGRIFGKS